MLLFISWQVKQELETLHHSISDQTPFHRIYTG